jgi:hypothetical protein
VKLLLPVAENLISDPKTTLQPRIDRYRASVEARGALTEQVTVPAAMTVPQMADLARSNGSGPVQMFGHCPVPMVWDYIDGHGFRPGSKDFLYAVNPADIFTTFADGSYQIIAGVLQSRAVGRADFAGMPDLGEELALTAAWLDGNDLFRRSGFTYASVLNCELDYLFPGVSDRLTAIMEAVTGAGSVLDTRNSFPFQKFFQAYAGKKFLVGSMYDGGAITGFGEYNTGTVADFASGLVQMAVMLMFCSNGWHPNDWYLARGALVGGAQAVMYGTPDPPSLESWTGNMPVGIALQNHGASAYTVEGDVMLLKPPPLEDELSQTLAQQLQAEIDDLKAFRDHAVIVLPQLVMTTGPAPPPPPPPQTARFNIGGQTVIDPNLGTWAGLSCDGGVSRASSADGFGYPDVPAEVFRTAMYTDNVPALYVLKGLTPGPAMLDLIGSDMIWGRYQDLSVNGSPVASLQHFNWAIKAGATNKAVIVPTPVTVPASGELDVLLNKSSAGTDDGHTWIHGLRVRGIV